MKVHLDGFEYIEDLRKQNGKQVQHFRTFSRYLEGKAREKGIPLSGQFELTPLCNFSCRMCYVHLEADQLADMCEPFGGAFYHSCGNWAVKIPSVLKVRNLLGADGAFSSETDPSPNDPEVFGKAFAGTGKILNLRAVGNPDTVIETVKKVWHPGLRLIVNTYCKTPEEQQEAYDRIQDICK